MIRGFWRAVQDVRARTGFGTVLRYLVEAALVHVVYGFFKILPLDVASAIGGQLIRGIGPHLRRSQTTVLPQLAAAMPDLTDMQRVTIMRDVWENMGRTFAEYAHLDDIHARIEVVGRAHLQAAQASGRPIIFITAHTANWELSAVAVQSAGIPLYGIYRAPNNPWVGRLLQRARKSGAGERLIAKGAQGARQILAVMRNKGALGLMLDQRLSDGVSVNFFGRPAMTAPAAALFAAKFNARVHYVRSERIAGAYFRVTISPEVAMPADQTVFLQDINNEIESWVRARPGQWLWTHRRWGK